MRIMHIYRDFRGAGGVPADMRALANAQSRRGHRVAVVSLKRGEAGNKAEADPSIDSYEIGPGAAGRSELQQALAKFKPDVVHFMGLLIAVQNVWRKAVTRSPIPYVISTNGLVNPNNMRYRWGAKKNSILHRWGKQLYRRLIEKSFILNSSGIHALSEFEAENLAAYGVSRIFTAPIGLDETAVLPDIKEKRAILGTPVRFLFLGRLEIIQKGLDITLAGIAALSRRSNVGDFRLVVAGPSVGDSQAVLENKAKELGLRNVQFTGPVTGEAKRKLWLDSDYFLHLSRFEGMSRAVREATGMGLPVIASRESNFGDWAASENMGFISELDPERIADVLSGAMSGQSRDNYALLSRNAWAYAKKYTWQGVAAAFDKGYEAALNHAAGKS
jgi:glycosyltransferase involved in cell wall biosynthesis